MLVFLGKVLIGSVLGIFGAGLFHLLAEGGFAIRGSEKYNKYHEDADARVKEILKNGSGSSKAELQEWWDTYH